MTTSPKAYILTVSPARGEELIHAADHWGPTVVQPVQYFSRPTRSPFIVFASFQHGAITHIANGERGLRAGTNMVQLRMNDLERLTWPIESSAALDAVPSRVRTHLARCLDRSGFLPRQTSTSFIAFMSKTDPKVDERLKQLPHGETASLTPTAEENLAFEKDAVGLLLRAGGMNPHILLNWRGLESENKPESYLGSLPLNEDTMIRRDASTLPGFAAFQSSAMNYGAYTFRGRGWRSSTTMTIIVAHPDRLERRTGADLIYLNEEYQSIAMVQYKAMTERNGTWEFRWQDGDRFSGQLDRMKALRRQMNKDGDHYDPQSFRFSRDAFFLKLCPRVVFDPYEKGLFKGMYIPLELWDRLHQARQLQGRRGGNLVTFDKVGRWINSTEFVHMLSNAWVGTSVRQSQRFLSEMIGNVLSENKTLTLGIKHP